MANNIKNKIKETFHATPVAFRWMLLVAAFVVVLILLFLLVNKPKHSTTPGLRNNRDVKLLITPNNISLSNVKVGDKADQTFKITATYDAVIDSVEVQDSVPGFSFKSCKKGYRVNTQIPCRVDVSFTPGNAKVSGDVTLKIQWHDKNDSHEIFQQSTQIVIPVSSTNALPEPKKAVEKTDNQNPVQKPQETPKSKPIEEPKPEVDDAPDVDLDNDDTPIEDEEEEDTKPEVPTKNGGIIGAENVFQPAQKPVEKPRQRAPEKCSDFAMPGYSTTGTQIGWIKPKDGRYEFHPFSDKDCNKPTGVYNPDTGVITSIDGSGKKIGTDAEHIGFTGNITSVPKLKSKPGAVVERSSGSDDKIGGLGNYKNTFDSTGAGINLIPSGVDKEATLKGSAKEAESVYSSRPFDRTFILRQFKPIPATIVSEVRADPSVYCPDNDCSKSSGIPVRATVDRNVYSDNGRTVILPTGTLLLGYLNGKLPGPYKSVGRMDIKWYQFIRPDGVEFNFEDEDQDPYSADSQGRVGVPGYGSTDYIEQMVMPLLTAIVPAAVNMIAPIADTFVNQIDLDNNTVVQSGTVRSSELAKNEVITAWNKVAQKLMVDALDNTVPPFSIAAGTRITVYSPVDLIATCGKEENEGKKCAFAEYSKNNRREWSSLKNKISIDPNDSSWTGQVRSFDLSGFCEVDSKGVMRVKQGEAANIAAAGYDYRTVLAFCESQNYQAKNQVKQDVVYQNQQQTFQKSYGTAEERTEDQTKAYNTEILGLEYEDDGETIKNPFAKPEKPVWEADDSAGALTCDDGSAPDANGCCPGETYEEMGADSEYPFACCPAGGGDCFPPITME